MLKNVDDFEPLSAFNINELHESEREWYEGEWLVNLPSGHTLEFDTLASAVEVCLNPPDDSI